MNITEYEARVTATLAELLELGTSCTDDAARIQGVLFRTIRTLGAVPAVGNTPAEAVPEPAPSFDAVQELLSRGGPALREEEPEPTVWDEDSLAPPVIDNARPVVTEGGTPMGGPGLNQDGEIVTIPGTQFRIDEANRIFSETIINVDHDYRDEEACDYGECDCDGGEEVQTDGVLRVRYERLDGQPLTTQDVLDIIADPISTTGLLRFGELRLAGIDAGQAPCVQTARFTVEASDDSSLNLGAIAASFVTYRGTVEFDGLGAVAACAQVNQTN